MPRVIDCQDKDAIELAELVELLETGGFDPDDEESIVHFGPALKRLGNNRRFLGDLVVEELKQRCGGQLARNGYSAQVILLHNAIGKFTLRANFWPAEEDSVMLSSGKAPFFYDMPHDHNFSFLTVGYVGPGYWSDYYEYDYERVVGFTGEPVDLRFVERSRLDPGKVMLYRKFRDVHRQLPPDAMSVSLNVLAISSATDFCDQYKFDVERREIAGFVNPSTLEGLVSIAGRLGGENGRELVEAFARSHPSERIRFAAWRAKAAAAEDVEGRLEVYARAAAEGAPFVSAMARREARRLTEVRGLLEAPA